MSEEVSRPKVGVGVWIFKDGKLLLGKRKGSHGEGLYSSPGGHLEFGETLEECAARETKEETGMEIENIRLLCVSNILAWEGKHYVDIGMVADWKSGEPEVLEPQKCEGWDWYDIDNLPEPQFESVQHYKESLKTGKIYHGTIR